MLPKIWSAFVLLLLAVTYQLWLPISEMPSVPLIDGLNGGSESLSWIMSCVLVASLIAVLTFSHRYRWLWWFVAVAFVLLFALDQHRLQPWAYQAAIYATIFASMPEQAARKWIMPFAISVYVFSAAGKFDFQFTHTVGINFLKTIAGPVIDLDVDGNLESLVKYALAFPAFELLAGLCLIPRRTRPFGGLALMGMHVSLLIILGPIGLNHSLGVLVWNVMLMVQAWFLFVAPWWKPSEAKGDQPPPRQSIGSPLAKAAVLIAIMMPLTERMGYWDHWLSWALYSPHNSRVAEIEVHRTAESELPDGLRATIDERSDSPWRRLAIDEWSLQQRGVPVYPQARFQLGLVAEIVNRYGLDKGAIRCKLLGVSDRRTGVRDETPLLGQGEILKELDDYWLVSVEGESR